ncbi:hypothetical protein [Bacillus sp. FSL K6-3431]|uniref:hypothetical protein n=1 Tax=Bacillus sp. FSL K6-3431 TaxID=2921500 RepID=UPI0030F5AB40
MTKRLPLAKDWQARNINDWNTTTFHAYMVDKHAELFGCDYVPMKNWITEKGLLGRLIGTSGKNAKPRTASNEMVKEFIDECFASYTPTAEYPGTSFGFSWAYRKNVWQRLQIEEQRKQAASKAEETTDWEDLADWL